MSGFTVMPRRSAPPPPSVQPVKLPRLAHIARKEVRPGTWVADQAVTEGGQWIFERQGRTWAVGNLPAKTEVKSGFRSLRACRVYIASGEALTDLERLQAGAAAKETCDELA